MVIMPRYDYECPGEQSVQEFILPMEHETPRCDVCGATMTRVYEPTPAIFRGKGWGKD